ncbi:MAG: preprotein translocase subunit SecG [bacterium]|nr:preprotein translocase subunit SecG [bacterium]
MNFLVVGQFVLAVLLSASILLQSRGAGLGSSWGGGGELYSTRRGVEKILFRLTVLLAILFIGSSLTPLLVQ